MGTKASKHKQIHEAIHLAGVPVTSISSEELPETHQSHHKRISFQPFIQMNHAIKLSQAIHTDSRHSCDFTTGHTDETLDLSLQYAEDYDEIELSESPIPISATKVQPSVTSKGAPGTSTPKTVDTSHKCWFVGNNEHNQFGKNEATTEHILNLTLAHSFPDDMHIHNIVTGRKGCSRILYDNDQFMIQCSGVTANISHYIHSDYEEHTSITEGNAIPDDAALISGGIASDQLFIMTKQSALYAASNINDHTHTSSHRIYYFEHSQISIKQIEATSYSAIVLSENGRLFRCDARGLDKDGEDSHYIHSISCVKTIESISCGADHTLARTIDNNVYSFGFNGCGQLGHMSKFAVYEPSLIQYFVRNDVHIVMIACGSHHSVVLDTNGKIYCFGLNNYYQIGNGNKENVYTPEVNETLSCGGVKVVDIKCGYQHNVASTDDGEYYLWGDNRWNQCLVYDMNQMCIQTPTKYCMENDLYSLIFPGRIIDIYPGWKETRIVST